MQKTFITTKVVDAIPMQALQAELKGFRTNDVPSETAGYEVTYEDGYKSWCPKDVFDRNAIELRDLDCFNHNCQDNYPDYVKRMFNEESELKDKVHKALGFINSEKFNQLDGHKQKMLIKQYYFMLGYLNVLRERIVYEVSIPVE